MINSMTKIKLFFMTKLMAKFSLTKVK